MTQKYFKSMHWLDTCIHGQETDFLKENLQFPSLWQVSSQLHLAQ